MIEQILLDQDGVLAAFTEGACKVHGKPNEYMLPENQGRWLETFWGLTPEQFWAPLNGSDFWANLEKTAEADWLVAEAFKRVGPENVAILTAPSEDPACIQGKTQWIARHYPKLKDQIIFARSKKFLAAPTRLLIDDRDKNIYDFTKAGGHAILVPRFWNSDYAWAKVNLEKAIIGVKIKFLSRDENHSL